MNIAIIPARGGSKRIPRKNIKHFLYTSGRTSREIYCEEIMKKFFRSVYLFFKGIGYARAASMHARMGDHKKAVEIMKEYEKCR